MKNEFQLKILHSILINKIIPKGFKLEEEEKKSNSIDDDCMDNSIRHISIISQNQEVIYYLIIRTCVKFLKSLKILHTK
jgi:hypothetical protein